MKKYECVQNMWKLEINSVPKAVRQVTLVMGILCSIQFYRSWKPSNISKLSKMWEVESTCQRSDFNDKQRL